MAKLYAVKDLLDQMKAFIEQVYFLDVCAIDAMHADWLEYGSGVTNYLAVPDLPTDTKGTQFDLPGGTIFNGDLSKGDSDHIVRGPYFQKNVSECITHVWYDGDWTRHPYKEDTVQHHTAYEPDKKVLLDQGASLRWSPHSGRSARAGPDRLREGSVWYFAVTLRTWRSLGWAQVALRSVATSQRRHATAAA
jgi:hydrogenase large subunit